MIKIYVEGELVAMNEKEWHESSSVRGITIKKTYKDKYQLYEIMLSRQQMIDVVADFKKGDKVKALCYLNSLPRTNGEEVWHVLYLKLSSIELR
jgi:hypothetical protein